MNFSNLNKIKVLLVDDDPVSSFIVSRKLIKLGIEKIGTAENGAEALKFLEKNEPHLIFLDINMPIMDGLEFMIEFKERKLSEQINIFILSSSGRECDREKFMGFSNVVGYIEKPLDLKNLNNAISSLNVYNEM
tara:strand:+ start:2954 stop:3355 length:402 start_codon:yes stop_codon:yes gene_type:complete